MKLGKRGKGKILPDYKAKHIYLYYKRTTDEKLQHTNGEFYKILTDLNNGLKDHILSGDAFFVPCGLGFIRIKKAKRRLEKEHLAIDWGTSRKVNKIVYFLGGLGNKRSIYKIKWFKPKKVRNISPYVLTMERRFKRRLAAHLKNNPDIDYMN